MQRFSHHDAHAKKMIDLIPRQPVWVQDPHTRTWYEGAIVSQAETPRSYIVETKSGIVRRNRIHLKERRIPTVKDQKVVRLQVKPKEVPKVPVMQESVNRPSVVEVPLVKSENESIKEGEKMEGKSQGLCKKREQKEEKKSEEVIEKSEAQNPRVGHNNATPTVSASQAP